MPVTIDASARASSTVLASGSPSCTALRKDDITASRLSLGCRRRFDGDLLPWDAGDDRCLSKRFFDGLSVWEVFHLLLAVDAEGNEPLPAIELQFGVVGDQAGW